ncbi:MAG: spore coat protein CotJB [Clostridia bacterium]|nr:spore coat protein CotJB [Clostridia bacterium]
MNERKRMLEAVYANGFAADEARLFLNTHPTDREAMAYYQKKIELYQRAVALYEEKYGPIRPENGVVDGRWCWGATPWPWEGGNA